LGITDSTSFTYNSGGQLSQKVTQIFFKGADGTIIIPDKKSTLKEYSEGQISKSTYIEESFGSVDRKIVTEYFYNNNPQSAILWPMDFSGEGSWFEFNNPWYGKSAASKIPFKIKTGIYDEDDVLADEYTFSIIAQVNSNGSIRKIEMNISSLSGDDYTEYWVFEYNCN
jgi:hypothetical protein